MTIGDLMKMVCSHSYEELESFCGLTKEELYEEYLPSLLREKVIWMTEDRIALGWDYDVFQERGLVSAKDLAREVKDGYWVYILFVSTEDMLFLRYENKFEAFKRYQEELQSFKTEGVNNRDAFTGTVDTLFIDTYKAKCIPMCKW